MNQNKQEMIAIPQKSLLAYAKESKWQFDDMKRAALYNFEKQNKKIKALMIAIGELSKRCAQTSAHLQAATAKIKRYESGEIAPLVKPLDWLAGQRENGKQDIYAEIGDTMFRITEKDDSVYLYYGEEEIDFPTVAEAKQYAQKLVEDFVCCRLRPPNQPRNPATNRTMNTNQPTIGDRVYVVLRFADANGHTPNPQSLMGKIESVILRAKDWHPRQFAYV